MPIKYLAFHKPYGVLSQFTPDHPGQATLADWLDIAKDIYPVGRLDKDSEGLLILTNDTSLNARLLDPKQGHTRTYLVQCEGDPSTNDLEPLQRGVTIRVKKKNHACIPANVRILSKPPDVPPREPPVRYRKSIPTTWAEITLREGKNRQVRRMFAAVGFPVLRLIRIGIGNLKLNGLSPGQFKELTPSEVMKCLGA